MTNELTIAFASPSDVEDEWITAQRAVTVINDFLRIAEDPTRFRLARWNQDVARGYDSGGAQNRIDNDLIDTCDVLVAVFRERFGAAGGSSESGTAYEISRAYDAREKNGRPEVLVYFKDGPYYPANSYEVDQLQKVISLREKLESKKLLIGRYKEVWQFHDYVQTDLYSFAANRRKPKTSVPSLTIESGLPTLARAECMTERMNDIVLRTGIGPERETDLRIYLNTQVTNRILRDRSADVFLMSEYGTRPCKLVMGQLVGSNSVLFGGVPVGGRERQWRISNLRVNSNALALAHASIICVVTSELTVSKALIVAGTTSPGLDFEVLDSNAEGPLAEGGTTFSQSMSCSGRRFATLRFKERFSAAFKKARLPREGGVPSSIIFQDRRVLLSEGDTVSEAEGSVIGTVDSGTRLRATFNNVPAGVRLFVSRGSCRATAGMNARVIGTERLGDLRPSDSGSDNIECEGIPCIEVLPSGGFGSVVWEVTDRANLDIGWLEFAVFASFEGAPHLNSPALGTASVNGSFSPISTVTGAAASPVPRFADTSSARNILQVRA